MARNYAQIADDPFASTAQFRVTPKARQMAAIIARDEPDGVWRCRYCRIELARADVPTWDDRPHPERDQAVPTP